MFESQFIRQNSSEICCFFNSATLQRPSGLPQGYTLRLNFFPEEVDAEVTTRMLVRHEVVRMGRL